MFIGGKLIYGHLITSSCFVRCWQLNDILAWPAAFYTGTSSLSYFTTAKISFTSKLSMKHCTPIHSAFPHWCLVLLPHFLCFFVSCSWRMSTCFNETPPIRQSRFNLHQSLLLPHYVCLVASTSPVLSYYFLFFSFLAIFLVRKIHFDTSPSFPADVSNVFQTTN